MSNRHILLVDDERSIRETLAQILEDMDLAVDTVASGEEALERLDAHAYDLVLLDLMLPGIDGMETLRRMRERGAEVSVVIFTAHGHIERAVEAMRLGAADFIEKPFAPVQLRTVVDRALQQRRPVPERDQTEPGHDPYRIVLPVSGPAAARVLAPLAAAAVHAHEQVELVVLQVIEVPWQTSPSVLQETKHKALERGHEALEEACEDAAGTGISIRPVVLYAHSTASVVANLQEKEPVDQVVLAWPGEADLAEPLSESETAEIIRQTAGIVTLLRASEQRIERILVLVSEGPDAAYAVREAHVHAQSASVATLTLLNVRPQQEEQAQKRGLRLIRRIAGEAGLAPEAYEALVLEAENVQQAIVEAAADFDFVCTGATRNTKLVEMLFGSVPQAVLAKTSGTVIVVRGPRHGRRTVGDVLRSSLLQKDA